MDAYTDMDGLVEDNDIEPCALLARFIEKRAFIMSCCILNFSRYEEFIS